MSKSSKIIIPLNHELSLREYGYSTTNTSHKRFKALMEAIKDIDNYSKIQKRLTVLRTYYKKSHTEKYNVFDEDIKKLKEWRTKNPDLYKSKKKKMQDSHIINSRVINNSVMNNSVINNKVINNKVMSNKVINNKVMNNKVMSNKVINNKVINNKVMNKILSKNHELMYSKDEIKDSYKIIKSIINSK